MPTVTLRALIQRINRKLAEQGEKLHRARAFYDGAHGPLYPSDLGAFYTTDGRRLDRTHVDVEALARELGAMAENEKIVDDDATDPPGEQFPTATKEEREREQEAMRKAGQMAYESGKALARRNGR